MICAGCNKLKAVYKLSSDNISVFICSKCFSKAKKWALSMEIQVRGELYDSCECGSLEFFHRVDDDGYIDAYVCVECGAIIDLAKEWQNK